MQRFILNTVKRLVFFSTDPTFHQPRKVNRQNVRVSGSGNPTENSNSSLEMARESLRKNRITGPFPSAGSTMRGNVYLDTFEQFVFHQQSDLRPMYSTNTPNIRKFKYSSLIFGTRMTDKYCGSHSSGFLLWALRIECLNIVRDKNWPQTDMK
jgi:hypothetical protein